MDAAECFDIAILAAHNILMVVTKSELESSDAGGVPLRLRFEGSSDLKEMVGELVKPELRREFARRSFYLYLRTPQSIEIPVSYRNRDQITRVDDVVDSYHAHLAAKHKGRSVYANHLKLEPWMGRNDHPASQRGVILLFKLALEEYEKSQLTFTPFESLRQDDLHVAHYLNDNVTVPESDRHEAYGAVASAMGGNNPAIRQRGYAYDSLYVTHPTIIQGRVRRPAPGDE